MTDYCMYRRDNGDICGVKQGISIINFRNPESKAENKDIGLCQYHSDQVIGVLLERYIEYKIISEKAMSKYKKEKQLAKKYETIQNPLNYQQLTNAAKMKYKVSHYECRNPLCLKSLSNLRTVFTGLAYHSSGKMRHAFYFCSRECWQSVMRMCGYRQKIDMKQTSLNPNSNRYFT